MNTNKLKILTIIPARGGSKGIPRKNVRLLNGQPLIAYSIENAKNSKYSMDVCVSTDDIEIEEISKSHGVHVIRREDKLASDEIPLDPVIFDAYKKMLEKSDESYDLIVTLQPTSPLLKTETLDLAIEKMITDPSIDTLISAENTPHLSWKYDDNGEVIPNYQKRLNRQYLPDHFSETGAFLITRSDIITKDTRIGNVVSVFELPSDQAIDIDTPQDWWVAEGELTKKNILIRVEGNSQIGLGHVYRGLSLAYRLINHNLHFIVSDTSDIAIEKLKNSFFPFTIINNQEDIGELITDKDIDIVINDILDTTSEYIQYLKSYNIKVVNFEDIGNGANYADAVINDLYEEKEIQGNHFYWGSDYYILRDEFLITQPSSFSETVKNILIIFGGVDPSNLTQKLLDVFPNLYENKNFLFTIIVGPGYAYYEELKVEAKLSNLNIEVIQDVKSMSAYMKRADLAVSSQGRTMLELASMGVPTILMAQNERELSHEFGYLNNGFINLGLGSDLTEETIASTLNWVISTPQVREQMHHQMQQKDLRNGMDRVLQIILN